MYSGKTIKTIFLDNFSALSNEKCMEKYCNLNGLTSLIKKPTYFRNPDEPACIDPISASQSNQSIGNLNILTIKNLW